MIGKMLAGYRNAAFIQETGEPDLRACTGRSAPLASTTTTAAGDKASHLRKRFKCTKVGRWCMWLRQCAPRKLREARRSLCNRCRLQWKRWFLCRGLQFGQGILLDKPLKLRLSSGARVMLGDRVESDGRVFITTDGYGRLNIGSGVYFNDGAVISCLGKITIGENTLFGPGVKIFDNNHRFSREEGVSRECDAGCIIRGKVPAGSLVTRSGEQITRPIETR